MLLAERLSEQFGVPLSKVRHIILLLVNQALEPLAEEIPEFSY